MMSAKCRRCGRSFTPKPTGLQKQPMSRMCDTCKVRNLLDLLDLPTPPELLDPHSKNPTLTEDEFCKELAKD